MKDLQACPERVAAIHCFLKEDAVRMRYLKSQKTLTNSSKTFGSGQDAKSFWGTMTRKFVQKSKSQP